jgi:hypothetical protein
MNAVVVIPCYQAFLEADELVSARQCLDVLGRHDVRVLAPEALGLPAPLSTVACERFPADCFAGVGSYNRLLLDPEFYARFPTYDYMLVHQLDAYVFRDELEAWCGKGFSYLGAPWPDDEFLMKRKWRAALPWYVRRPTVARLLCRCDFRVGNGGFSLRHIPSFLRVLADHRDAARNWVANEDVFWSLAAPAHDRGFRVPSERVAMHFAVERNPADYVRRMGGRLPFGCHAWRKHGAEFWQAHIRIGG